MLNIKGWKIICQENNIPGKYQRNLVLLIYQNAYSVVLPPIINQISISIDFEAKKNFIRKKSLFND